MLRQARPTLVIALGTVSLIGLIAIAIDRARSAMRESLIQEERLHGAILVCDVVRASLERNGFSRWPASWDELAEVPPISWGPFYWPKDRHRLEELVSIDFATDLDAVTNQSVSDFTAVHPKGAAAALTYQESGVGPLLHAIQQHRRQHLRAPEGGT